MSIFWQNVIIGLALVGALAYVTIWMRRRRRKQSTCERCLKLIKKQSMR